MTEGSFMFADLSTASAATISELRLAILFQSYVEHLCEVSILFDGF